MKRYEYKVIDTGKHVEQQLNELGAQGWHVVCVTTKKQLFIAPPQAIILMREVQTSDAAHERGPLVHATEGATRQSSGTASREQPGG